MLVRAWVRVWIGVWVLVNASVCGHMSVLVRASVCGGVFVVRVCMFACVDACRCGSVRVGESVRV